MIATDSPLHYIEGNDPTETWSLATKDNAGTVTPVNLSGYSVELYLKESADKADNDASSVKITATITNAAAGQVTTSATASQMVGKSFYHLDAVSGAGKRLTYAYGTIQTVNV